MADNLLFAYSVEEKDEAFVITLAGKLAMPIMQDMAAQAAGGRGSLGATAGVLPYSLLASQAVRLMQHSADTASTKDEMTIEDIFAQGFDRDLDEFERQLVRYQTLLPAAARDIPSVLPSGIEGDEAGRAKKAVVKATNS